MQTFPDCIAHVLAAEGGLVNDPCARCVGKPARAEYHGRGPKHSTQ